jgi:NAD(P)-dependent dehydrogenase (short-subunit alcohol dehydrogenase family)
MSVFPGADRDLLHGKVAVITGGTSGIGAATAELFVARGAKVVLTGRNVDRGAAIVARLGAAARFLAGDVTREDAIKAAIDLAVGEFGRLDCLFNNAGGPTPGELESVTAAQFHYAMDLLLGSVLFGIKHAAPVMKRQECGAIINNSSVAALRTGMGQYLYGAAKAAVTHLTREAAIELAPHGITVNSISPGGIATPIFFGGSDRADGLDQDHVEASMAKLHRNLADATPLRRAGVPLDIAHGVAYLASDAGAFVNGHDLVIDAGMTVAGRTRFVD